MGGKGRGRFRELVGCGMVRLRMFIDLVYDFDGLVRADFVMLFVAHLFKR